MLPFGGQPGKRSRQSGTANPKRLEWWRRPVHTEQVLIGPRPVTGDFAFVQIELRLEGLALGVGKDGVTRHPFPSSKFLSFNGLHEAD